MEKYEQLIEMAKPIVEELKRNFHPHMSVVIESDRVRVEETVLGVPEQKQNASDIARQIADGLESVT